MCILNLYCTFKVKKILFIFTTKCILTITNYSKPSFLSNTSNYQIKTIVQKLQHEFNELKKRHSILVHQNFLGFIFFSMSITAILCSVHLWNIKIINTWLMVFWIAFWTSILHELEHDLIHGLYFKKNKWIHNFMLFFVWFFRPLTLNPWIRRYWHNYHHQHSGKVIDIEERGVTNGEKWSLIRLLITPDLVLGFLVRFHRLRKEIMNEHDNGTFTDKDLKKLKQTVLFGLLPFGIPLTIVFYIWILVHGAAFLNLLDLSDISTIQMLDSFISPIMFVFVIPNLIRQFCLHFITSNMHYYGDIEEGNIIQQTQVLNVWWTWPFQLFCFNFGSTHSIHHFVVMETFYNRQLIAKKAHEIMKRGGVLFNDTGSFTRSNNYHRVVSN